jgi:hypothetical protein
MAMPSASQSGEPLENSKGLDVARVLDRDLTGQAIRRSQQIDGRSFIIERDDCGASFYDFRRRELSALDWWWSLKAPQEFAWFRGSASLPSLMIWIHLAFTRAVRLSNLLCSRPLHSPSISQDPGQRRKIVFRVFGKWLWIRVVVGGTHNDFYNPFAALRLVMSIRCQPS